MSDPDSSSQTDNRNIPALLILYFEQHFTNPKLEMGNSTLSSCA